MEVNTLTNFRFPLNEGNSPQSNHLIKFLILFQFVRGAVNLEIMQDCGIESKKLKVHSYIMNLNKHIQKLFNVKS